MQRVNAVAPRFPDYIANLPDRKQGTAPERLRQREETRVKSVILRELGSCLAAAAEGLLEPRLEKEPFLQDDKCKRLAIGIRDETAERSEAHHLNATMMNA